MATYYQWKRGKEKRRSTMMVSGPDMGLAEAVCESVVSSYATTSVLWFDTDEDAQREIVEATFTESHLGPQAIIIKNAHKLADWRPFIHYAAKPTFNTMLVLQVPVRFREGTKRWIPSTESVLYVDCAYQEAPTLMLIAQSYGLEEDLAAYIVDLCGADSRLLINEASKFAASGLRTVGAAIEVGALRRERDQLPPAIRLASIGSPLPSDTSARLTQLEGRIRACLALKLALSGTRRPIKDIAEDARIPIFLVPKLMPFVKDSQIGDWIRRLQVTMASINYARQGQTTGTMERVQALWNR